MRVILFLVPAIVIAAAVGLGVYMRLVALDPGTWHVEPASARAPRTPNFVLLTGADAVRLAAPLSEAAAIIDARARADGAALLAGDPGEGFVTYVARSRVFGFPDAVSLRLSDEGVATRVEVFSRSVYGRSDLGANRARVDRWLAPLVP